jgi:hypothetical protein
MGAQRHANGHTLAQSVTATVARDTPTTHAHTFTAASSWLKASLPREAVSRCRHTCRPSKLSYSHTQNGLAVQLLLLL